MFDLIIYLTVMFLVREIYFTSVGFIINGLFWSLTTLLFATWRMKARGISWKELGLCKPASYQQAMYATLFIIGFGMVSIVAFQIVKHSLGLNIAPDQSSESAVSKFGELKDNWLWFFTIIPAIWLESALEELLDRGFLMCWIEKMLSSTFFAMVAAVILQAMIFGFRHSYDISERSITVALIGLAMGIGYVAFGRNLWPLIVAHCLLNTVSMVDRVI
jgi:hypothetical protein